MMMFANSKKASKHSPEREHYLNTVLVRSAVDVALGGI
jgi:hypothetical protein